jgi:hypothetical protein
MQQSNYTVPCDTNFTAYFGEIPLIRGALCLKKKEKTSQPLHCFSIKEDNFY